MLRHLRIPLVPRLRRRFGSGVVLCFYLITILGMPVPALAQKKDDNAEPTPVAACGCPVEAKSRGCCCCSTSQTSSETHSCCAAPAAAPVAAAKEIDPKADAPRSVRWGLTIAEQRCKGLTLAWIVSQVGISPPTPPDCRIPLHPIAWVASANLRGLYLTPPIVEPPPRDQSTLA